MARAAAHRLAALEKRSEPPGEHKIYVCWGDCGEERISAGEPCPICHAHLISDPSTAIVISWPEDDE